MYTAHFGLNALPFSPTATPENTYQSPELAEALGHFAYAIQNREPFLVLTGEVGSGKTTAIRVALGKFRLAVSMAVVNHATLTPREALEAAAICYNLDTDKRESKPKLLRRLETKFARCRASGRPALLIFDEAHLLKPAVLEELRLLSNLSRDGENLVQIFLVGQPELEKRLKRGNRSLRQRVSVRYQLKPLSLDETGRYLAHRLKAAGCSRPSKIFSKEAVEAVHRISGGLPREINVVAGYAMLTCFLAERREVSREHVRSVRSNYSFDGVTEPPVPEEGPVQVEASETAKEAPRTAVEELVLSHQEVDDKTKGPMLSWSVLSVLRSYLDSDRRGDLRKLGAGVGILVLAASFGAWILRDSTPAHVGATRLPPPDAQTAAPSSESLGAVDPPVPGYVDSTANEKVLPRAETEPVLETLPAIMVDKGLTDEHGRPVTLQIASLLDPERADRSLAKAVDGTDIPGAIQAVSAGGVTWYVILLGCFPNVQEAKDTLRPVLPILRDQDVAEVRIKRAPSWLKARLAGEARPIAKPHP